MEKIYADLHSHTINSDGTYTVEEIVKLAKEKGLKVLAITDHDTIDGLLDDEKINNLEKEYDIKIIRGIEMSCNIDGKDVHILGYFVDTKDEEFLNVLKEIAKIRDERNDVLLEKLAKHNVPVTKEDLKEVVQGNILSKAHIAEVMVRKGYVKTKPEAFELYLGKNGVAFTEKRDYKPQRAVDILVKNGAFVSLAHPKLISTNIDIIENLVTDLVKHGLRGLEVNYYSFYEMDRKIYRKLAKRHNLIITGGSDFHGGNRVNVSLGDSGLTQEEYENMKKSLKNS